MEETDTIIDKLEFIRDEKVNKIIPENIKSGVNILNVTGSYEGSSGVKLFDTIENMQADATAEEGDLAVVYREELAGIDENSEFSSCTFPNTVVLSSAYTGSAYCSFRAIDGGWFDGMVDVSSSSFRFDGYGDEMVRVEYTSSDGITYTRTDGGEELVEFGTTIKWESGYGEPFPEVVSNFMKIGGNYFEGLYENVIENTYYINNYYSAEYQNGQVVTTQVNSPLDLSELNQTLINAGKNTSGTRLVIISGNTTYLLSATSFIVWLPTDNKFHIGNGSRVDNTYSYIKIENNVVTSGTIASGSNYSYKWTDGDTSYALPLAFTSVDAIFTITDLDKLPTVGTMGVYYSTDVSQNCSRVLSATSGSITTAPYNIYRLPSTQLDATTNYVYGKTFYGKNGVEEGGLQNTTIDDLTKLKSTSIIYNNLSSLDLSNINNLSNVFNGCGNIKVIPTFTNTDNVTNMANLFVECYQLRSVSNMNTQNVVDMHRLFDSCFSLKQVPNFDTSNVTNMSAMFSSCYALTEVPNFNTSNVTNMNYMFQGCRSLTEVPDLDTNNVTDMGSMFQSCNKMLNVPNLNISKITSIYSMFSGCANITEIPAWNFSNITNIMYFCSGCTNLVNVPNMIGAKGDRMFSMFANCNNLSDASIQNIINLAISLGPNIIVGWKNLKVNNSCSPFYQSNITSSRYSNRLTELSQAGWTY